MKISKDKKNSRSIFGIRLRRCHGTFKRCPGCGRDVENDGHYVPPSMGEKGFWICGGGK